MSEFNPVIRLAEAAAEPFSQGDLYQSEDAVIGKRLGLTALGCGYSVVPPGKSACPFHNHHAEDEMFVILEGEGVYRFGANRFPFKAGDVLGAPAGGPDTAHQIINTGNGPLRYLAISSMAELEIAEYPDSGKFLARAKGADGKARFREIRMKEGEVDYWAGEPGA
ncbi:putative cupin superfamily protein [Rhizobium sp. SG_E_25_P2]|uniref:cupin domain-containing protein n=1 Tax=Rhizobium sp. SG_E_25_P2 TaxID=2879942 RepID=UPI0024767F04|nr:cupin domain-containing protein [Rhizobium sp. SG_E_25_P2]MDH6266713.1 putative cupin superfamily protein [Rhizobium sp. SG_E_25_P2]